MSELRSGGLIRVRTRSGSVLAWAVPAWAVLCGALASGQLGLSLADGVRLLLALLLVEAGWGTLWTALSTTDWATPIRRWRNWHLEGNTPRLPYTQPGSPGDRLASQLSQLRSWAEVILLPSAGRALGAAGAGLLFSLALAASLGAEIVVLCAGTLASMQLALVFDHGRGQAGTGWDGVLRLGLPWLAGHLAFASPTLPSVAAATAFAVSVAGAGNIDRPQGRVMWAAGQLTVAALFIPLQHPLAASFLVLLLVPQLLLPAQPEDPRRWTHRAWPWMAAGMLMTALVL